MNDNDKNTTPADQTTTSVFARHTLLDGKWVVDAQLMTNLADPNADEIFVAVFKAGDAVSTWQKTYARADNPAFERTCLDEIRGLIAGILIGQGYRF